MYLTYRKINFKVYSSVAFSIFTFVQPSLQPNLECFHYSEKKPSNHLQSLPIPLLPQLWAITNLLSVSIYFNNILNLQHYCSHACSRSLTQRFKSSSTSHIYKSCHIYKSSDIFIQKTFE